MKKTFGFLMVGVALATLTACGCVGKSCCGTDGSCCKSAAKSCPDGCQKACCKKS